MPTEKPYYIIGTAGHIDHGKTSLIKALTGIETDRLKEEKERGITIDLGFAYFNGPDGRRYGIVDVPGHEKFIPNMLAGAHGFDVVMMVVAADDGVKPQTIEHFEILHLLKVPRAMFVITKIDLVKPEKIDEVREEIEILTHESYLANSRIIPVSNTTGAGLKDVANEISRLVSEEIPRTDYAFFRFPIDRAFTITGFGTVATGTVISGEAKIDDEILLVPDGRRLRIRNIEVFDEKVEKVSDGQRAAINLAKIEKTEILRGMELVSPELEAEMHNRYFAALEMLPHRYCNLKNFSRVRLFKGTMETMATLINIEEDVFKPKGKYVTQINFHDNSLILSGERFIIRDETNRNTVGGGEFLIPAIIKRARIPKENLSLLRDFPSMNLVDKITSALVFDKRNVIPLDSLSTMFNRKSDEIISLIKKDGKEIEILPWRDRTIALHSKLDKAKQAILDSIKEFHAKNPELPGIEKKGLREKLHDEFANDEEMERIWGLLIDEGRIADGGEFMQLKDFKIEFKGEDAELKKKILEIYSDLSGNTPKRERLPEITGVAEEKINRIFQGLVKSREIILLTVGVHVSRSAFEKAEKRVVDFLKQKGELAVAEFRDMIGTNRNMAVLLLEAMDSKGVTVRKGNTRVLKKSI